MICEAERLNNLAYGEVESLTATCAPSTLFSGSNSERHRIEIDGYLKQKNSEIDVCFCFLFDLWNGGRRARDKLLAKFSAICSSCEVLHRGPIIEHNG